MQIIIDPGHGGFDPGGGSNDFFKEWLDFRQEEIETLSYKEDKEHFIYFEEITDNILDKVSDNNIEYVKAHFKKLDDNILDHMNYWFEKYYRNGFCDGVQLVGGCLEK